jgi:hypothetical protein
MTVDPLDPATVGIRAGYCYNGVFLDLFYNQPRWDLGYRGAVPANYVHGVGATCSNPPAGYVYQGLAPRSLVTIGGLHPYYAPPSRPAKSSASP